MTQLNTKPELDLRAQNWINALAIVEKPGVVAADLIAICPANDSAAEETLEKLDKLGHRTEVVDGVICVRPAGKTGMEFYKLPPEENKEESYWGTIEEVGKNITVLRTLEGWKR